MINIKNFLKKYWLFIILSLIVGLLIGLYLINKNQDQKKLDLLIIPQQEVDSYPIKTSLKITDLENNIKNINQQLEIYEVSEPPFSNDQAIKIAQSFNLLEAPKVYNDQRTNNIFYEWLNEEKFLTINLSNKNITFELIKPNLEGKSQPLDLDNLETNALNFLKTNQLLPPDSISLIPNKKGYLEINKTLYQEIDSAAQANGAIIQFQYQINSKSLVGSEITFIFNSNQELIKFNYQSTFTRITTFDFYPLKDKAEILAKVKNYKDINYFNIPSYYTTYSESENLTSVNLKTIEIIYLKNELRQNYLQPFFFIKGEGTLNDGRKAEVGLYLPAIKDEYLLQN